MALTLRIIRQAFKYGLFFVVLFLAQRYWFGDALRRINRIRSPLLRPLLLTVWALALSAVVFIIMDWVVGSGAEGYPHSGSAAAHLAMWLGASTLAWGAVMAVKGAEWLAEFAARRGKLHTQRPAEDLNPLGEVENPLRRRLFQTAGRLAGAAPFVIVAYGYGIGRLRFRVEQLEVPVAKLPAELDGLRIVQLSDIHVGTYFPPEQVRRAVEMANELGAQLAVVTGDFMTDRQDPLERCIEELSRLRTPLGTWGCLGNHEMYAHAEAETSVLCGQSGIRILRGESAELSWRGATLNLLGVDYQREYSDSGRTLLKLKEVEPHVRHDAPNILLSHNPNVLPRAAELGIELTISGHTHGGQIRHEFVNQKLLPWRYRTKYYAGLYQHAMPMKTQTAAQEAQMYVNRGLGTLGVPMRLGVPPEITLLTLRRA